MQELVQRRDVDVQWVPRTSNPADMLTKPKTRDDIRRLFKIVGGGAALRCTKHAIYADPNRRPSPLVPITMFKSADLSERRAC